MSTIEPNRTDNESQALLPIRSVSQITGVNPITLRAWERRYDLIRPTRTPAGHRLYSQQDIRTIQRIQELAESGMGFAQIALLLDQESQEPSPRPQKEPGPAPVNTPARSLLDRVIRAAMDLDPTELRAAEATALMWLTPEDYLRDVLIEALAQLEARISWPDRDLGLIWLSEYVKGRADWVADAPGHAAAPVVVVDNLVPGRAFSAGGLRLFSALHDDRFHARLLPTGLNDAQREQMVRRWGGKAWIRLGAGESPRPAPRRAGARVFWCDLPLLQPRDGDEAVNFMQRWRQVIEDDIQLCRNQVADALGLSDASPRQTRH
ncbi:MerR family transcriptional regulator [Guyparkeria hydrothermalis]|uniref:MerR family transcriptional regulator n=1 Tax=Guyparkeria hydrothermalis TaxID=923 RepID=UPI002020ED0D|nr:MerR family transcriptional regulator [Guyparkeria hydrothermalis]MCL7745239.1 MerR family transcriptional regulator [Guyparkeria hydrothermalis]